jgi:hypothetical protein
MLLNRRAPAGPKKPVHQAKYRMPGRGNALMRAEVSDSESRHERQHPLPRQGSAPYCMI